MVQSPILARYAAAAYRLRQKPLGMCCKSCQQWVWGHHKNPPREGAVLEPIGHVWPKLGEAAITGPQYFLEDFGAHEVEEPWGPGEAGCEPLAMTAGDKTSKTGEANQSQSSTELQSQGRRTANGPTRKDWCRLSDIIVQEPADCLKVKSAQLLDWIEEFEPHLEPGTLGHWVANRIPECLEADEEDSIGILACIEDLKLQAGRKPRTGECTIMQANVTQYRSEVKHWLVTNQCQVTCVQETHVENPQQEGLKSGLSAGSLESWALPAEGTQGGSTGGLVTVAKTHLQTRHLHTLGEQGKGCIFIGIRFQGWQLAIGNVYLESGKGPGSGVNPGLLAQIAVFVQELRIPWIMVGDWNCTPEELASAGFLAMVKGRLVVPAQETTTQGSEIDYAVASEVIAAINHVEVDWDVPFRPHAAVRYSVHKGGATMPVPQAPRFGAEPGDNQDAPSQATIEQVEALFEEPTTQPVQLAWGQTMQRLETQLGMDAGVSRSRGNRLSSKQLCISRGKVGELRTGSACNFG